MQSSWVFSPILLSHTGMILLLYGLCRSYKKMSFMVLLLYTCGIQCWSKIIFLLPFSFSQLTYTTVPTFCFVFIDFFWQLLVIIYFRLFSYLVVSLKNSTWQIIKCHSRNHDVFLHSPAADIFKQRKVQDCKANYWLMT